MLALIFDFDSFWLWGWKGAFPFLMDDIRLTIFDFFEGTAPLVDEKPVLRGESGL